MTAFPPPKVVLVVEDEPLVRRTLVRLLDALGHTGRSVPDAEQALSVLLARDCDVDLVLSDVEMPGMSGLALREILAEHRPRLPVLIMSGRVRGDSAQIDLEKPFNTQQLTDALSAALAATQPTAAQHLSQS